jgi:hypothetical protein
MPSILILPAWHPHHLPQLFLSAMIADQHGQQFPRIDPVGFRPPQPPVNFQTGRVHHHIVYSAAMQVPVQPKTIPPGLIATHRVHLFAQAEMPLGFDNRSLDLGQIPSSHGDMTQSSAITTRQPPSAVTQFKSNVENRSRRTLPSIQSFLLVVRGKPPFFCEELHLLYQKAYSKPFIASIFLLLHAK